MKTEPKNKTTNPFIAAFIAGYNHARKLHEKELREGLTDQEDRDLTFLINQLWGAMSLYGLFLAHPMLAKFNAKREDYLQAQAELFIAFGENLFKYEPDAVAEEDGTIRAGVSPTTYFRPYFIDATRKYIRSRQDWM